MSLKKVLFMIVLIRISICLLGGLLMSRLAKKLNLPAVTSYLVAGVLLGPYCLGSLGLPGIGFQTPEQVEALDLISQVALGFIAFTIGNEFRLEQLKHMGKQAITVGILQAVITTCFVDVGLIILHFLMPSQLSISSAITLGAIAAATAPAATLMVVRQYKANGPLTKLLLLVVAIDDAVGLVLFAASFGIATALESGVVSMKTILLEPVIEIVLSIAMGALAGWVLFLIERFFHSRSKRLTLSLSCVLMIVGCSTLEFDVAGVHIAFSLLLVCMMAGTVFCNICDFSEELMSRVDDWTAPLFVLFFVLSGAELNLSILANPLVLIIGGVYILCRSLGKYSGAYFSCKLTRCNPNITRYLGITLLPQAGVALGMALTARQLSDGEVVRNVVLFSVLVYELIGPALTKRALLAAGEIKPEGRTSARRRNPAVQLFHLGHHPE